MWRISAEKACASSNRTGAAFVYPGVGRLAGRRDSISAPCPVRSWARACPWNYGNQAAENVSSSRFHHCNLLLPDPRLYYYSSIINKIGTIKKILLLHCCDCISSFLFYRGGYYYHCDCYFFFYYHYSIASLICSCSLNQVLGQTSWSGTQ